MIPLYGHTSPESAYLVSDYPYGFKLRTKIRYWIESHPTRGFRFCQQTMDPKRAGDNWNAPKKSTYAILAMNLFLDEKEHVSFSQLTEYSSGKQSEAFIRSFPDSDYSALKRFAPMKAAYLKKKESSNQEEINHWDNVILLLKE